MSNSEHFLAALQLFNEALTATVVIIAVSILLYNLARNHQDRVTRTSSLVLLCVIIAYVADVFISLEPGAAYLEAWLRFQWIGIAYVPATLLHLSDALLATTGRPSRGRRRFVVRLSYGIGSVFAGLALFTDLVIDGPRRITIPHMDAGPLFPVYVLYLVVIGTFAIINVVRARRRCLTRYTQRRMTYLLTVFLTPVWGTFPFSLLGTLNTKEEVPLLIILNMANTIVMFMLILLAYPLSFFGTEKPDRVIKSQLLEFMLRGPFTGAVILMVILFIPGVSNVLGLNGTAFMPFAAVATLLFLQWSITLVAPILQRYLIYTQDQQQAQWIERLTQRLLTPSDASQLLETILAALCDQLRIPSAFVATLDQNGAHIVQIVGGLSPSNEALTDPKLVTLAQADSDGTPTPDLPRRVGNIFLWNSYWLVPLRSSRRLPVNGQNQRPILGILGVWSRSAEPRLDGDELQIFETLTRQAARVLEDIQHQSQIFVILEGLASQMDITQQQMRTVSRYGHISPPSAPQPVENIINDPQFPDMVRDALRDYWGGPRLTESELLKLNSVWREMEDSNDANPVRALRHVLTRAIENLRPPGERSLTTTEWILYNILEMRFLQGRKVRDVALRLAMSESDLYRKQRIAIEELAHQIEEMERAIIAANSTSPAPSPGESSAPSVPQKSSV